MEDIIEWGHCLNKCPSEDIRPVCQTLPEYPFILMSDIAGQNYTTNSDDVIDINDVTLGVNSSLFMLKCFKCILLSTLHHFANRSITCWNGF